MDFNHRYSNHIKRSEVRGKGVMLTSTVATITGTVATFTGAITILIGTVATFTGKIDISIGTVAKNRYSNFFIKTLAKTHMFVWMKHSCVYG